MNLNFIGDAGQSLAIFKCKKFDIKIVGEANNSACKSMCNGKTVIAPQPEATYALYVWNFAKE